MNPLDTIQNDADTEQSVKNTCPKCGKTEYMAGVRRGCADCRTGSKGESMTTATVEDLTCKHCGKGYKYAAAARKHEAACKKTAAPKPAPQKPALATKPSEKLALEIVAVHLCDTCCHGGDSASSEVCAPCVANDVDNWQPKPIGPMHDSDVMHDLIAETQGAEVADRIMGVDSEHQTILDDARDTEMEQACTTDPCDGQCHDCEEPNVDVEKVVAPYVEAAQDEPVESESLKWRSAGEAIAEGLRESVAKYRQSLRIRDLEAQVALLAERVARKERGWFNRITAEDVITETAEQVQREKREAGIRRLVHDMYGVDIRSIELEEASDDAA